MWKSIVRPFDIFAALFLWLSAIALRVAITDINSPDYQSYIKFGILLGLITAMSFTRSGLYDEFQARTKMAETLATLRANFLALLGFITFCYFFAPERVSRGTVLIYALVSGAFFVTERIWLRAYVNSSRSAHANRRGVLLVGNGTPLRAYIAKAQEQTEMGVSFIGWLDAPEWAKEFSIPRVDAIEQVNNRDSLDAMVVSYVAEESAKVDQFLKANFNDVIRIFVVPDFKSYAYLGVHLEDFAGVPVLALNQPRWSATDLMLKRALDIFGAGLGLLILSPLLLFLALGVKLTSRGPIFFGQERMGLDGKTFKMWKFRSMKPGPNQPGWTSKNDPRRTRYGSFLRATSLDELPQLWNVLVGNMSLVGPRPEQPYYVENFRKEIPAYMLRHKMKAGITGWAQVNGWRGDTSIAKRIECDLFYIRNWSLALDVKILFLTVWKGFVNQNAY